MDLFKTNYHLISTILFVLFIVVAHILATNNYNWTQHTISDLGAQGYNRKPIMQIGFLLYGLTLCTGIFLNGLSLRTAPILIYGLCVALTGIFCTKPFVDSYPYSTIQATWHSIFAQ